MISKMLKMQMLEDEDDLAYAETEKKARPTPRPMGAQLMRFCTPPPPTGCTSSRTLSHLKRTVENIKVAAPPTHIWGLGQLSRVGPGQVEVSAAHRAGVRLGQARGLGLECPRVEGMPVTPSRWSRASGAHSFMPGPFQG